MAEQEIYIGSTGPIIYDDTDVYDDGVGVTGIRVQQMRVEQAPVGPYAVIRLIDLAADVTTVEEENFITEFLSI